MSPVSSTTTMPSLRRRRPRSTGQPVHHQPHPKALLLCCCTVAALLARTATAFLPPASSTATTAAPVQKHLLQRSTTTVLAAATTATPQAVQGALVGKSFRDELITLMTVPQKEEEEDAGQQQAASVAQRIEFVVGKLAETYVPPQTLPFMNLLLEGTWVNTYNSWAVRRRVLAAQRAARKAAMQAAMDEMLAFVDDDELPAAATEEGEMEEDDDDDDVPGAARAEVEVRGFEQRVAPNGTTGSVVNTVRWACRGGADAGLSGSLLVRAGYELNSRGILELAAPEHDLRLTQGPKEPEALVRAIQRAVPFDAFDPNATFVETAFADHEVRATRTHSTRFGTVVNLYVRNGTELHRRLQDLGHLPPVAS